MLGSLREKLPTIGLAGAIAAMIWLYAEGENLREETFSIDVRFVDPGGNKVSIDPRTRSVTVTAQAPNSTFSEVRRISVVRLEMEEKPDLETYPRQTVSLRERLAEAPAFANLGAGIIKTDPESVTVSVQRLEEVTLAVQVVRGEVDLRSAPVVEPAQVTFLAPASLVESIADLPCQAVIDGKTVATLSPNTPYTVEVPITMSPQLAAALGEYAIEVPLPRARVSLTLRSQEETYEHPSIPIRVAAAWTLFNEYKVDLVEQVALEGVVLRGPREAIEQIRGGDRKVWADIELTSKDFETPITSAAVRLAAPQGVFAERPLPNVEIKITRRSEAVTP